MDKKQDFIIWFKDITIDDISIVGGKNGGLGEMYSFLTPLGVNVPNGFAITAAAYRYFLDKAGLKDKIKNILIGLNTRDLKNLQKKGKAIRQAILKAELPEDLQKEILKSYKELSDFYGGENVDVAVRTSATAEDLAEASFAGAGETYLNVRGPQQILAAVRKCISSLFTDRSISYREEQGFDHIKVALSVGVQKMVRSDLGSSGVIFTLDTESGFDKVIVINSIYGLGEMIVKGRVIPDEFIVFKPTLEQGFKSIIAQDLGVKNKKMIYAEEGTKVVNVDKNDREKFSLTKEEVLWAKDGKTGELFIVQARPETVYSLKNKNIYQDFRLEKTGKLLLSGIAVGKKIGSGKVNVIKSTKNIGNFKKNEVLVTKITDPDWEPIMKIASAIVTDEGGRTSHAAIVSRELGIPCIVGTEKATKILKNGMEVTIDCASSEVGRVYEGILPFEIKEHKLDEIPKTKTKIMVNIGSPDEAFKNSYLPVSGVGLGRLEFIIASHIKIHPNALIDYPKLKKSPKAAKVVRQIDALTSGYKNKEDFYIDELAEGIAKIGAAFWPNEVVIRFSDFKTNEYSKLIGGDLYEPAEENPMLGWRGASRYYDPKFKKAFGLECAAFKKVREVMGLKNTVPMIPFCRTPEEGRRVVEIMETHGLDRKKDKELKIYVMCEIPSNILLADEFLDIFDGMSIGSNDLTQLVLGLDRDSGIVTHIANENNPAVKKMIAEIIAKCKEKGKYIGICGQAPSDYPEFAEFLVEKGISSMSLNPDTVIKNILRIAKKEKEIIYEERK
ncbi:MAG: pyruvate, water dikinase [Parcubacteria group bacterium Athens1014_26]|nr:MAG: pyruvate, water dikinase [Parcubacteria group bacterium Athens1014_26]